MYDMTYVGSVSDVSRLDALQWFPPAWAGSVPVLAVRGAYSPLARRKREK